ncbi:hypothetical protein ACIKTA_02790 [Hansschlegelia beijingensis]
MLAMSTPLLRDHLRAGTISGVDIGQGAVRRKWVFRLADIAEFIEHQAQRPEPARAQCQSRKSRPAPTTSTNSSSVVTSFAALRARRNVEPPRRSSAAVAPR